MLELCVLDALEVVTLSAKVRKNTKTGQGQDFMNTILPLAAYVACIRRHALWPTALAVTHINI